MRVLHHIGLATLALIAGNVHAAAAPAPPQLRNKTITVAATMQLSQRAPDGRIINPSVLNRFTIYVSTAGRAFARSTRSINTPSSTIAKSIDLAPGRSGGSETREMQFDGGKLVGVAGFSSGAARMAVSFEANYTTCKADFVFGKVGGAPIQWKGVDGVTYTVESVTPVGITCTIQDGNAFSS